MKTVRMAAVISIALSMCIAAVGVASAPPIKNVVLVHGAFADGSSWAKVISILHGKGYNVTAVQNPLTALADDVAAFAPDEGETVSDLGKAYPPPPALASPIVDAQGFITLSADAFLKFGSDLPEQDARIAAATQGPIAASAFGAQVSGVAWKTKPSWYIVSTLDEAIAPDEERFFAKRMKAKTTELKASHVPMLSQPEAVAAVIMDAAANAQVARDAGAR